MIIKYILKPYTLVANYNFEMKRSYFGFYHSESLNVIQRKDARVWDADELKTHFGETEFQKMKDNNHEKYELEYLCDELDEIFDELKNISKAKFINKETIDVKTLKNIELDYDYVNSPVNSMLKGKQYSDKRFIIRWNGIVSHCGSDIPYSAIYEFIEKLRRHFDYDDPYKHNVLDNPVIESIWRSLGGTSVAD